MSHLGLAMRVALALVFTVAAGASVSCQVNEFCLNCGIGDGEGGPGGDAPDDGGVDDAPDAGPCVQPVPEICDGIDNDCDGMIDEGNLPEVGDPCPNQMGECAGGVKECVSGQLRCSKQPTQEICDLKDNDCNGLTDEGNPGGGGACGTNTGECVAGINHCINGQIQCQGFVGPGIETCNGLDDDCDGLFDEGLQNLGPCVPGVDGPIQQNEGQCNLGTRSCQSGGVICVGAVFPSFELCNGLDDDCDGTVDNGYNTMTDPLNCGMCGHVCNLPNAFAGCAGGMCTIAVCAPGFHDINNNPADGCEYACTITGNELCDGIDNDCDGVIDENVVLPLPAAACSSLGACLTGTTVTCEMGALRCNYNNPNVSKDAMGNIIPETSCDGIDNDCDGIVDNMHLDKGQACDNGQLGACRSAGTRQCNAMNPTGPTVCQFTLVGQAMPQPEVCDGIDNDCNGTVDDGAAAGNMTGQDWVSIPGLLPATQIMRHEASRPDARAADGGSLQTHVCSRAGVQPWTNVTYPQAVAACSSIGARLCTEAEWQTMCVPPTPFPVAGPGTTDFTFIEAEDFFANTTIGTPAAQRAWTRIAPAGFNGVTAMQVPDNGFSVPVMGDALAQSSRMDYRLTLLNNTTYRMWLRMRAPATDDIFRGLTAPTPTLSPTAPASTQVGDLVIVTTWSRRVTTNGVPGHALQTGFTQIFSQSHDDGSNDGRLSVAYRVATTAGAQTYQAYNRTESNTTDFSGITVIRAGRFDPTNISGTSNNATGDNAAPDPPNLTGLGAPRSLVLAVAAWHLSTAANINATPPANFTELWEVGTSQVGEVSMAAALTTATSVNPGTFGPTGCGTGCTNNGNARGTIAIGLLGASVYVGLNAGTSAGAASGFVGVYAEDQWHWRSTPPFTTTAAGTHTFSIYTHKDGAIIDSIAVSRQAAGVSPTFDNSWAYQNNPRTAQPQTCNADPFDTDPGTPGDQDDILATGSMAMCFANKAATNRAFDMSGNVKEWTLARAPGQNPMRGGASNNTVEGTTCKLDFSLANDAFFFPNVGFRCCR